MYRNCACLPLLHVKQPADSLYYSFVFVDATALLSYDHVGSAVIPAKLLHGFLKTGFSKGVRDFNDLPVKDVKGTFCLPD